MIGVVAVDELRLRTWVNGELRQDAMTRDLAFDIPTLIAAQKAFPPATVLRPSVMFAVNEGLLGVLEKLAQSTPIIPLIGGGDQRQFLIYGGGGPRSAVDKPRRCCPRHAREWRYRSPRPSPHRLTRH